MSHGKPKQPLGLGDTDAVEQRTDLGQAYVQYYEKDNPNEWPLETPMSSFATLRNALEERYESDDHYADSTACYIPCDALRQLMNPRQVLIVVRLLYGDGGRLLTTEEEANLEQIRDEICFGKKTSWKLLAALILAEEEQEFHRLRKEGMCDACLPLVAQRDRSSAKLGLSCREPDHEHPTLSKSNWSMKTWRNLIASSYAVKTLYLKRIGPGERHIHYILHSKDLLPIKCQPRVAEPKAFAPGDEEKSLAGGFGCVTRVWFHSGNCEFSSLKGEPTDNQESFALKQLYSSDVDAFNKELASLLYVKRNEDSHLIQLLATFEIRDSRRPPEFYLVFPWAEGNLWHFWQNHDSPEERQHRATWMADQCYHLARALKYVHGERSNQLSHYPDIRKDQHELFGRHGDVKAENVLWFKDDVNGEAKLVMTDFGLGRLHTRYSRSGINPRDIEASNTYRAPEFDLPDLSQLSRRADIFSLGCMFLEFVTWYLRGHHSAAKYFVDYRSEADPVIPSFKVDTFFTIKTDATGEKTAVIKGTVLAWISELKAATHPIPATRYINRFLDLIQNRMLTSDPSKRIQVTELVSELKVLCCASRHSLDD